MVHIPPSTLDTQNDPRESVATNHKQTTKYKNVDILSLYNSFSMVVRLKKMTLSVSQLTTAIEYLMPLKHIKMQYLLMTPRNGKYPWKKKCKPYRKLNI